MAIPKPTIKKNSKTINKLAESWIIEGAEKSGRLRVTMKRTSLDLPENLHENLRTFCFKNRTTQAEVIRSLLEDFLGKQ